MVQPDLVVDVVLGGRLAEVGQDGIGAGDRLVVLPRLELIAERVQVRIGADARVAEQVPGATRRAPGLQDRERLVRLLGLQVVPAPMPEMPAPTISTSTCSMLVGRGVVDIRASPARGVGGVLVASIIGERVAAHEVKMHQSDVYIVQTAPVEWERPSDRIRELIRHGAELVLNAQSDWLEELDQATLSAANVEELAADPVLNVATRRSTRANLLHWAAANVSDPGAPVPANLGPEPLAIARDLVRRGLSESALQAYRVGQNVAWQRWMAIAFALTSDPDELRELLDVSARSLFEFVDATIAGIAEQIQVERDELTRGSHAERREAVALILDGAPISKHRAEARLGYGLDQIHTAAVVWGEPECDSSQLDRAARRSSTAQTHGAHSASSQALPPDGYGCRAT